MMYELNKASMENEVTIQAMGRCWCVCICLIFTERRHSDALAAGHAVAAN